VLPDSRRESWTVLDDEDATPKELALTE
jgi:hypothetical protein